MNKGKILVTGGAGFIGSHTAVELSSKGFEVCIADNFSNARPEVLDAITAITGKKPECISIDLCDTDLTAKMFREHRFDAIIHFAAKKLVGESVLNPMMYYKNNLLSLMNVVGAAIETGCNNFVFSSSCTVYGQPDELPVRENSPLKKAESPYGNTKKIAEDILSDVSKVTPFRTIALRYFNPVGAHASALIGEYPLGTPSNLMPIITQCAIGKRPSFQVFGNDYNTPDGSCIRDYIHVTDLAIAHVVAIERLLNKSALTAFEVFNLGTGNGVSVFEIINSFEKVNNIKLNFNVAPRRSGDVEQVWADTSLANKVLGWKATHNLDQMVASAWAWEKMLHQKEIKHVNP
ncbi:MAG: UDP-glucose 4-epimerase GalE [Bacteroidota bacterium]|nr:UDP-glucose 4-epimerase GalE [Bacteroidota bacterium]